jgi:hypothetical protein
MNAVVETDRLLSDHGAILVREGKHRIYQLPGGQMFTRPKTPSDHRSTLNNLASLRRALGIRRAQSPSKGEEMDMPEQSPAAVPAPELRVPAVETFKQRIEAAIASEEATQEKLLAEAQAHERKVHMLKALLPFAEDANTEGSLRSILPSAEAPAPPEPGSPPAPPDAITERVQVTRQLVLAATQTFDEPFTVNDVMTLMVNGREIEGDERGRVRQSIAQAMATLHERGKLVKEQEHFGRRQTIWRKAQLNGGYSNGIGTRA